MKSGKAKPVKRRRPKVRVINSSLEGKIKETLRKERLEYVTKNCPHMAMIGSHQGVCSDAIIDDILMHTILFQLKIWIIFLCVQS